MGYGSDTGTTPVPVSEGCLVLNVIRPSGFEGEKLPVGVWIYGFATPYLRHPET